MSATKRHFSPLPIVAIFSFLLVCTVGSQNSVRAEGASLTRESRQRHRLLQLEDRLGRWIHEGSDDPERILAAFERWTENEGRSADNRRVRLSVARALANASPESLERCLDYLATLDESGFDLRNRLFATARLWKGLVTFNRLEDALRVARLMHEAWPDARLPRKLLAATHYLRDDIPQCGRELVELLERDVVVFGYSYKYGSTLKDDLFVKSAYASPLFHRGYPQLQMSGIFSRRTSTSGTWFFGHQRLENAPIEFTVSYDLPLIDLWLEKAASWSGEGPVIAEGGANGSNESADGGEGPSGEQYLKLRLGFQKLESRGNVELLDKAWEALDAYLKKHGNTTTQIRNWLQMRRELARKAPRSSVVQTHLSGLYRGIRSWERNLRRSGSVSLSDRWTNCFLECLRRIPVDELHRFISGITSQTRFNNPRLIQGVLYQRELAGEEGVIEAALGNDASALRDLRLQGLFLDDLSKIPADEVELAIQHLATMMTTTLPQQYLRYSSEDQRRRYRSNNGKSRAIQENRAQLRDSTFGWGDFKPLAVESVFKVYLKRFSQLSEEEQVNIHRAVQKNFDECIRHTNDPSIEAEDGLPELEYRVMLLEKLEELASEGARKRMKAWEVKGYERGQTLNDHFQLITSALEGDAASITKPLQELLPGDVEHFGMERVWAATAFAMAETQALKDSSDDQKRLRALGSLESWQCVTLGPMVLNQIVDKATRTLVKHPAFLKSFLRVLHRDELRGVAARGVGVDIPGRGDFYEMYFNGDSRTHWGYPLRFLNYVKETDGVWKAFVAATRNRFPLRAPDFAFSRHALNNFAWQAQMVNGDAAAAERAARWGLWVANPTTLPASSDIEGYGHEPLHFSTWLPGQCMVLDTLAWSIFRQGRIAEALELQKHVVTLMPRERAFVDALKHFEASGLQHPVEKAGDNAPSGKNAPPARDESAPEDLHSDSPAGNPGKAQPAAPGN